MMDNVQDFAEMLGVARQAADLRRYDGIARPNILEQHFKGDLVRGIILLIWC